MSPRRPPHLSKLRAKRSAQGVEKSHPKSHTAGARESDVVIDKMGRVRKGIAIDPTVRGRGPFPGAPNAGRPRKEVRRLILDILMNEGVAAAREVLRGEPDKLGRVPDHAQRLAWFRELSEIGLNEKIKLARIEASAAGATLQNGVQLILQGGPAGNLQRE